MATTLKKKSNPKRSQPVRRPTPTTPAPEAPDRGRFVGEAPERRVARQPEAPDWGDAQARDLERDFTQGRSQS